MAISKRIYVGNIIDNFHSCIEELYIRFQKFGICVKSFECHETFAYINMEFESDQQYNKLKSSFNNFKFKGNVLKVDIAKMDWKTRWNLENENKSTHSEKKRQLLQQQWKYYKKLNNINKSWNDLNEVMQGRFRNTPRKSHCKSNITFRVNLKGVLKKYKHHKTKLWGYSRDKDIRELVFSFTSKYWKDGNGHIVDKLDYSRTKPHHNFYAVSSEDMNKTSEGLADLVDDEMEIDKNRNILSTLLDKFDFAKPIDMNGDDEEDGGAEYEYQAIYKDVEPITRLENMSSRCIYDCESEDVLCIDEKPNEELEHISNTFSNALVAENNKDKVFTSTPNTLSGIQKGTISNTNTLRNLFNPDKNQNNSFNLIRESDEDIDHDQDLTKTHNSTTYINHDSKAVTRSYDKKVVTNSLFFPHFESPFLIAQTQLNKIINKSHLDNEEFNNWETEFWGKRGSWTREMKRKKRDAIRNLKKRYKHQRY